MINVMQMGAIKLKIRLYQFTILFAKNCTIEIKEDSRNESLIIEKGSIAFFERHLTINVNIKKEENEIVGAYDILSLSDEQVNNVVRIISSTSTPLFSLHDLNRGLSDKVHCLDADEFNSELFYNIKRSTSENFFLYGIVCLLSRCDDVLKIYPSLYISASRYFSDKVKKLFESDLSRKWRLSSVAEKMNLSEITVRKKLEAEKTSFNQLLLDVRMFRSMRLLLDNDFHIGKISELIGMSSPSYFIKVFSNYYGVTPKQFYLYHKKLQK
ncbi:TPA: helix-turn-helix transcriptional regulator [Escherichia coli]|nr:helix-turn-helix transcriptional regulator [Escherichia coli]